MTDAAVHPASPDGPVVHVRRAEEHDVPALAALRRTWARQRPAPGGEPAVVADDPEFERAFASWWHVEAPRRVFWIAETAPDSVLGSLNVVEIAAMPAPGQPAERWGYVGNLVVPAEVRVRGVPRLLIAAAVAHARDRRWSRLVLRPAPTATAFYRAVGFRPAGEDMLVLEPDPR